jgi:hypothetical protein
LYEVAPAIQQTGAKVVVVLGLTPIKAFEALCVRLATNGRKQQMV